MTRRTPANPTRSRSSRLHSSPGAAIRRPDQVRALASPARQEIVDALESAGPCSIATLARLLGRAPDSLYFHVRVLTRVGLIRESGVHKAGRHASAMYDLTIRPLTIDQDAPVVRPLLVQIAGGAVRLAMRDFTHAMRRGSPRPATLTAGRVRGWITPAEARRLESNLAEILAIFRASGPAPGRMAVSFSWIVSPSAPQRRARRAQGA